LILDEPTNGLDPQGIHQIREIIKKIAETGTTILLASHLLDEVEKVCSHVVILQKGKKLYSGSVDGMNASHGFFTLKSDEHFLLKNVLEKHPDIASVKEDKETVIAIFKNPITATDLNKYLFENNIILSH